MKVSKAQASDNRDAILRAAASQMRGRGFDHMSVEEVARAAGLTHGALYSHFKSKDALKTEATKCAFAGCAQEFAGLSPNEFLRRYLSAEHRDNPEEGCPTSALVTEVRRQPLPSQMAFREGVERFVALAGESLESIGADRGRDRATFMFAAMVGGLALSRAIAEVDRARADDILRAVAEQLAESIGCSQQKAKKRQRARA